MDGNSNASKDITGKVRTGRFAIIEQFLCDGITYMFGNPGTVEQGFLDALESYPEFKYIMGLQETIPVGIGDGYARKAKKPTIVQLHSGVGLGNGIGMMYQALRGHSPLVVIAGDSGIKYDAMDAQMACDLVSMAKPVTKWATRVLDSGSLLRVLRRAMKIATTPPMGPVFVGLPADVLDEINEEEVIPTSFLSSRTIPDEQTLQEMATILATASNPLFIVGDGIAFSGAQEELASIAKLVGATVWGADSSEVNMAASNPQFGGLLGHMFGEQSQAITEKPDVVLICGTYVFPEVYPLLQGPFAKDVKIIHIDLNAYEIGKNFPVAIGVISDPKMTLGCLYPVLSQMMSQEQTACAQKRVAEMVSQKEELLQKQVVSNEATEENTALQAGQFMEVLAKYLPKDAIIFDEALTSSGELNRYIPADVPGQFFQTRGGSLGVGIPSAIGIKLAAPDKTVIGFTGDGGSMYTIQALWTAAHYQIGAKFVICNNRSYKLLKFNIKQYWKEIQVPEHLFPQYFDIINPEIRFDKLAESMGVPGIRVEKANEIETAIQTMLATDGPFLIDLVITESLDTHKN